MDIVNMYPTLDVNIVKEEVFKMVVKSKITIVNVNWKILSIHILHNTDKEKVKELDLETVMPSKTSKNNKELDEDSYTWNDTEPNDKQVRNMLGIFAQNLIEFIMMNRTYAVGEYLYLQTSGGSIGLYFTRVL